MVDMLQTMPEVSMKVVPFVLVSLSALLPVVVAALTPASSAAFDRPAGRMLASRSETIAKNGMVCAAQPLAVEIGIDILKAGGSAVDAMIAVNAALGLMEPVSCGVGGDLFAIVWDAKSQKLYGLNASGRSPYLLTIDEVKKRGLASMPYTGVLSETVPGCVDGWFELHKRFGKLPMKDVLEPAIRYAEEGFPVSEVIAHYWAIGGERLKDEPNFAATYLPEGRAPSKGEIFRNPGLARTYRMLATEGRDAFYRGSIAQTIDVFQRRIGGTCASRISRLIPRRGSSRSARTTAATTSGSSRRTHRGSRRSKCSISSRATISRSSASEAPGRSTS